MAKHIPAALGFLALFLFLSLPSARAQQLTAISPASAEPGESVMITITGDPDYPFTLPATVTFYPATGITHDEPFLQDVDALVTTITIPADTPCGPQDVVVHTQDTSYTGEGLFTVCQSSGQARITGVSPSSGTAGSSLHLTVTGADTHFTAGVSRLDLGSGITVAGVTVNSELELEADITISADAAPGARDVVVTTSAETARGEGLFEVLEPQLTISPASATQGETLATVTITGSNFTPATRADLGAGISIGGQSSPDAQTLVLDTVAVAVDAPVGPHDVILSNPSVRATGAFTVVQGPQTRLLAVEPDHGDRGHPGLEVLLTGQNTHFDDHDVTVLVSAGGVATGGLQAEDSTHLRALFVIARAAPEGAADVTVALGRDAGCDTCESVTLPAGFTITAPGSILAVEPSPLPAGQTVTVTVHGSEGYFAAGQTALYIEPDQGITIQSVSVSDTDTLQAELVIADDASGQPRDLTAVTGTEVALGEGMIDVDRPGIESIFPSGGVAGTSLRLTIQAVDVTFDASTQVSFSGAGITVDAVSVDANDPARLFADISIAAEAPLGARDVTVSWSGGSLVAAGAFTVSHLPQGGGGGCSCAAASKPGGVLALVLLGLLAAQRRKKNRPGGSIDRAGEPK